MEEINTYLKRVGEEIGAANILCPGCKNVAASCESTSKRGYVIGECLVFACNAIGCLHRGWIYCKTCQKTYTKSNIASHPLTKKHMQLSEDINRKRKFCDKSVDDNMSPVRIQMPAQVLAVPHVAKSDIQYDTEQLMNEDIGDMFRDESANQHHGAPPDDARDGAPPVAKADMDTYPKLSLASNEWIAKTFAATPRAELQDLNSCFDDMDDCRKFWIAEHATDNDGKLCGGGLRYLVARTFQNSKLGYIDSERMPSFVEARWHIDAFMQYQTMDEKQRQRQARITRTIMDYVQQQSGDFFRHTFIPEYKTLSKMYGKTGKQSLWNILPIPPVENLHGVSYVSPVHIFKYLVANAVPIDQIVFDRDSKRRAECHHVGHVDECTKTAQWHKELTTVCATQKAIMVWGCDWKDGFGPSRTKNNRGSVDAMTITFSPPKHLVNATANTFLVAVGLKRYTKGWNEVAHRFRKAIRILCSPEKAIKAYHGEVQKVLPFLFKRYATITDKVERADTTCTIGSSSDQHRCFGVAGQIKTPKCKLEEIKGFLREERLGVFESQWGWCDDFIDALTNNPTGAKFPACKNCRRKRLQKLGVILPDIPTNRSNQTNTVPVCSHCADWSQHSDKKGILNFPKSKDFPSFYYDECPVQPPPGREVKEGADLPQVELSFDLMVQATRYAFWHASRPKKGDFWTKAATCEYLRTCGIGANIQTEIYAAAEAERGHDDIDYKDKEGIGLFKFPAPWISELSMKDYIETAMHLLFLGIAESLLDLVTRWLKECKAGKSYNSTSFRRSVQPLLEELKKFQLAWLMVYPFTGKDQTYKTGSWVGENWLAFIRVSPILFGWCVKDYENGVKNGFRDVSRVMLSYHAVCARVMTHQKISKGFIEETENLMKEFLSCVRELDIRVRHESLTHGKKKKSEAFWLKTNFMSLLNIIDMMKLLGPIILWWDGGGKGERFIQEIKPHILRGVREDFSDFFPQLHRKMYKVRTLSYFEKRFGLQPSGLLDWSNGDDGDYTYNDEMGTLQDLVDNATLDDRDDVSTARSSDSMDSDTSTGSSESSNSSEDSNSNPAKKHNVGDCVSQVENDGMFKSKTIYIYRNENMLNEAVASKRPISGILEQVKVGGKQAFEFRVVLRKPVKLFSRRSVTFQDKEGVHFHGMWYSDISVSDEHIGITGSLEDIKKESKLSAVAVPLRYVVGDANENSSKYCVITNYWRVRNCSGQYVLPTLDPSLYGGVAPTAVTAPEVENVDVSLRSGNEYGEL